MPKGIDQYRQVGVSSAVPEADGHLLVQMLLDGAIERCVQAEHAHTTGDLAVRGEAVSAAIGIVGGLRDSLNMEQGQQIAVQLESLYEYIQRRLIQGNADGDPEAFQESCRLLREIREGWAGIREEALKLLNSEAAGKAPSGNSPK